MKTPNFPPSQIAYKEVDGEILPPDDMIAYHRDQDISHIGPTAINEQVATPTVTRPEISGQLPFSHEMPEDLKRWRAEHPTSGQRSTIGDTALFLANRDKRNPGL